MGFCVKKSLWIKQKHRKPRRKHVLCLDSFELYVVIFKRAHLCVSMRVRDCGWEDGQENAVG